MNKIEACFWLEETQNNLLHNGWDSWHLNEPEQKMSLHEALLDLQAAKIDTYRYYIHLSLPDSSFYLGSNSVNAYVDFISNEPPLLFFVHPSLEELGEGVRLTDLPFLRNFAGLVADYYVHKNTYDEGFSRAIVIKVGEK